MNAPLLRDIRSARWPVDDLGASPVVLFLHGYGSSERDLGGLAPALGLRLPWASLRAPLDMGRDRAAWFEVVVPGSPEPAAVEAATESIWNWVDETLGPAATVVPIGFSQGGLMATELLRTRPARVVAPVVLGGFVSAEPHSADEVLAASRPALFWGRGAQDRVIAEPAVLRTTEFLPRHTALVARVYPGLAHGINVEELADVHAFLAEHVGLGAVTAR